MKVEVLQEMLRPKNWDQLMGMNYKPDGVHTEKELFIDLAKSDRAMSIILYGPPGTGKTSAAIRFAHEYLGEHIDTKFKRYNASSEVNKSTLSGDVIDFAGSEDDTGLRNIIDFEEVDGIPWQAQDSLRAIMEDYSYSCIFLMTCNKIKRVHGAIISRSATFKMDKLPEDWCVDWFTNAASVCKVDYATDVPRKVLNYYDGDLRRVISDFFTKFYGKTVYDWSPAPTFAQEIFNSSDPIETYCKLARETYIDPIQLLHEIFDISGKKNAKTLSLSSDRILSGGDVLINMVMALETLRL